MKYRRRDSNPHRLYGPRRSERRAYAFRHSGRWYMAPAGIGPAARRVSTSRSTGELQKPGVVQRNRRESNPHLPDRQSGARPLRYGSLQSLARPCAVARRTNDAPTRESRPRVRTPFIRRPPAPGPLAALHTCIHRLSKSRDTMSPNANRPTWLALRRWGDRASPSGSGPGPMAYGPGSAPPACVSVSSPASPSALKPASSRTTLMERPPRRLPADAVAGPRWRGIAAPLPTSLRAGRMPPSVAAAAATGATFRSPPNGRVDDTSLTVKRPSSSGNTGPNGPKTKKSRLRGLQQVSDGLFCSGRIALRVLRLASNRGPTGRDSRSSGQQSSKWAGVAQ